MQLLPLSASAAVWSQLAPAMPEDFAACWQLPAAAMQVWRPKALESEGEWVCSSDWVAWTVPGQISVARFRQLLAQQLQTQPWLKAQWLPIDSVDTDSAPDWALLIPKQTCLDFEYIDLSDMPVEDEESGWAEYGQMTLVFSEACVVHRLLKLADDRYVYLCCFWPGYLTPQAQLSWLQCLAQGMRNPLFNPPQPITPQPITPESNAPACNADQLTLLEQTLGWVQPSAVSFATCSRIDSPCQQQQTVAPQARQILQQLIDADRQQGSTQLLDRLAWLTALLIREYFNLPTQGVQVVCYPHDASSILSGCQPFFVRNFKPDLSLATPDLSSITQDLSSEIEIDGVKVEEINPQLTWANACIYAYVNPDLPIFSISHLCAQQQAKHSSAQVLGVQLWLVETTDTWYWQLRYDAKQFMPLQWLARLEQLLVQGQTQTSHLAVEAFLTSAELRAYQRHLPAQTIETFNATQPLVSSLLDWIYHHARLTPERIAIQNGQIAVNYRQVWQRACGWAQQLKAEGAGSEQVIALHFATPAETVIAILAVWLSGAAAVIVDVAWPLTRKHKIIQQAHAQLIIGVALAEADVLPLMEPIEDQNSRRPLSRPPQLDADALAAIVLTHEWGDAVQGIEITHRQLALQIYTSADALGWLTQNCWSLGLTAPVASSGLWRQLGLAWSQGGAVWIDDTQLMPANFDGVGDAAASDNTAQPVDYLEWSLEQLPQIVKRLQAQPSMLSECRQVVIYGHPSSSASGSNATDQSIASLLEYLPTTTRCWIAYGCPESVGFLALQNARHKVAARYASLWPMGNWLPQVQYRVINAEGRLCPWGLVGELYLREPTLSRLYLLPARANAWVTLPEETGWWLRTGDRVLHDHKGQLFWQSRDDGEYFAAGMRVVPQGLAQALCTILDLPSLAIVTGLPVPSVVWQVRNQLSTFITDWRQYLPQLSEQLPQPVVPVLGLALAQNADQVVARLGYADDEDKTALQLLLQQSSQAQQQIIRYWQQRCILLQEQADHSRQSVSGFITEITAQHLPADLASLSLPVWWAAWRLAWTSRHTGPTRLCLETTQWREGLRTVITQLDIITELSNPSDQLMTVSDWLMQLHNQWQQGLQHQPVCVALVESQLMQTQPWLSQDWLWLDWQLDETLELSEAAWLQLQARLTQQLHNRTKHYRTKPSAGVMGVLRYRQQIWCQMHTLQQPLRFGKDLLSGWIQTLNYVRDFPQMSVVSLRHLSQMQGAVNGDRVYPLTLPQRELLEFLQNSPAAGEKKQSRAQLESEAMTPVVTAPVALGYWVDHHQVLNLQRWQQTLQAWVNHYLALRSYLVKDAHDQLYQRVQRQKEVVLLSEDWSDLQQDWQAIANATQALIERPRSLWCADTQPVDGAADELLDYYVIQLRPDLWRLLLVAHPLVLDDRACGQLLLSLYRQYRAEQKPLLAIDTYPVFMAQQQQYANLSLQAAQMQDRHYWREVNQARRRATHHVPLVRPQQVAAWRFAGGLPVDVQGYRCQSLVINQTTWLPLQQQARRHGVPVGFVIKIFYGLLLANYLLAADDAVGADEGGGSQATQFLDGAVFEYDSGRTALFTETLGCFCRRRSLWLPASLLHAKTTQIEDLLQHAKNEYQQAKQLPLLQTIGQGLTAHFALIDVQDIQGAVLGFGESLQQPGCLSLVAHAQSQRLTFRLHYFAEQFNPLDFLPRLVSLLEQWIAGVKRLADLDFLLPDERYQQMQVWSQGARRIAKWPPIYRLIDEQVVRTPDAAAVQCGAARLSYQQMDNLANQTAQRLVQLACQSGEVVLVCTDTQIYLPSAMLGVIKTGACYLPVNTQLSQSELQRVLLRCRVRFLLTQAAHKLHYEQLCPGLTVITLDQFDANRIRHFQPRPVAAKDPLYVIYRSQDTSPVWISYEAAANLVQWYCSELCVKAQDRFFWHVTADFYATQKNIFAALVSGACMVISAQTTADVELLRQEIDDQQITLLNMHPDDFYPLINTACAPAWQALTSLRVVVLGKASVEPLRLQAWLGRPDNTCRVLTTYSHDLCADVIAAHWLDLQQNHSLVPLGKPIHGMQMFIMDSLGRLKPTGLSGEVVVLSQSVARCAESITSARITNVPGVGRLFYTGDWAYYERPGQMRYVCKRAAKSISHSHAIENTLRSFEGVVDAKLVQGDEEWVVYLQLANQPPAQAIAEDLLQLSLQPLLPAQSPPLRLVRVDQLPEDAA